MQSADTSLAPPETVVAAERVRELRSRQAWTLLGVSTASIVSGLIVWLHPPAIDPQKSFFSAAGFEFVIWGAIDLIFAVIGTVQSAKASRQPITDALATEERTARDKLLTALRFNHKLNISYLIMAVALFGWAISAHSATLFGHGTGVLLQGGFLFFFDSFYVRAFEQNR